MKTILGLCALLFVALVGWRIGGELSSDAIGMALGVLFGIMAGIPAALMVLAAKRHDPDEEPRRRQPQYQEVQRQLPPVIVVTGQARGGESVPYSAPSWDVAAQYRELSGPRGEQRAFRIIGEDEDPLKPW